MVALKTFDEIFEKLNKYQKEAVTDESLTTLVNANVGSGKTTVLIAKVLYQHFNKGVAFKDMVVLTFTNKAAGEIKKRIIEANVNIKDEDMLYFGTFHSVALKMLKTLLPVDTLGYTSDFTVMDPEEFLEMAMELILEKNFNIKYKNKLIKRFERLKIAETSYARMKYKDDIEALWEALCIEKRKQNKMDFQDLILNAINLLETVAFSPKWIIVDEFQDCDETQLKFIKAIKNEETRIFAVGDPNQIIYTWRGSRINIFTEFKKEYNAIELTLPVNYRSSANILELAKCFIVGQAALQSTREVGKLVSILNHYDPFNEANYLAEKITELHKSGVNFKDIAVFYRMQKQSQVIEEVFNKGKIPFEVSVRKTLTDIPVLRWFVALLKASTNEKDTGNLVTVLKDKTFGEGLTRLKINKIVCDKSEESSSLCNKIRGFERWSINVACTHNIYDYFDLDSYLSPTSSTYGENKEYVHTLINRILQYGSYKGYDITEGIKGFINSSALYGVDILKEDIHISEDSVKLMTLHACKGLEFKYVFIIGTNNGLIPLHSRSSEEDEEEKRLFFVGITRAIDNLEISYYTSTGNSRVMSGKSSFLYMLPKHLIKSGDYNEVKSDLRAFRHEIKNNMGKSIKSELIDNQIKIKVRHGRYGLGTVESEDNDTIRVLFENYGMKEFTRGFNPLEFL